MVDSLIIGAEHSKSAPFFCFNCKLNLLYLYKLDFDIMSKKIRNFKKETQGKGVFDNRTLQAMDDYFKEQSERYRRRRRK